MITMLMEKKRNAYSFFILFIIMLFFMPVLVIGITAHFKWVDPNGNTCHEDDTLVEFTTANCNPCDKTSAAPYNVWECCNHEGKTGVRFCPHDACTENLEAYDVDWDNDQVDCECYNNPAVIRTSWKPGIFFVSGKPSCCGDDSGEYLINTDGREACCLSGGANVCVSLYNKRCRYEQGQEVSCHDGLDNDCDGFTDCKDDTDCKNVIGIETNCRDGIDNDCDKLTDCSDSDCDGKSLDCIGCAPEICDDTIDNDCDGYIDCVQGNADSDCVDNGFCDANCAESEICNNLVDDDCDGKVNCTDSECFEYEACKGCKAESAEMKNCDNTKDDDCDGFVNHLDRDCPGCNMNTKLCADGSCKESCDPVEPQGCVGTANENCEEGEGCACKDCEGKRDSCDRELVCDTNAKTCKCPSGTTMCSDGRCRTKCFVCGDGTVEPGEECDKNNPAKTTCPGSCTGGDVTCKDDCTWDTSSCTSCPQCDPTKIDNYCCVIPRDGKCDSECTANADPDCTGCTYSPDDCCYDKKDGKCDFDCINYKDPDCSTSCTSEKDGCCDVTGEGCDPDCDTGIDPDCGACTNVGRDDTYPNECCNNDKDGVCDPDCIQGVDPDCKCGNGIIDTGETCDSTNLDSKSCNNFFLGYGGLLACFNADGEHACHFDTSGCHKIPDVCTGGSCGFGKDCRCPECIGEQSSCGYGAICDATARCACIDGTTLCIDSTCRTAQNCKDYDGREQLCLGTANGVCDVGEGCGCPDCEGKKGPCNALSVCQNGVCTGCFLKNAYWSNIKTGQAEDCIGSGNDIKMTVEGTPGCEDKTIAFTIQGVTLPVNKAVFKNNKAELVWPKEKVVTKPNEDKSSYDFEASLEGGGDKIGSTNLEVEYCVKECDADCDRYCEKDTIECKNALDPKGKPYCNLKTGTIILDANALSGWCENCDPNGLSKGQESCAAYYDCTPGWWGNDADYSGTGGAGNAIEARTALEWGDCGVDKGATGDKRKPESGIGNMRNRLICPLGLTRQQCCANQANCYCKIPNLNDPKIKKLNCNYPEFRPTELKGCLSEEKFPFFTNMNILIVVLILTGFYILKTRRD